MSAKAVAVVLALLSAAVAKRRLQDGVREAVERGSAEGYEVSQGEVEVATRNAESTAADPVSLSDGRSSFLELVESFGTQYVPGIPPLRGAARAPENFQVPFTLPLSRHGRASAQTMAANGEAQGKDASVAAPLRPTALRTSRHALVKMNLLARLNRLLKANVNELISNFEDPEKILEQAVEDMQKDLVKVRQAFAEVSASTKRMEVQIRDAEVEGAKWYERAQLAVDKGEDELARQALSRRKALLEKCETLKQQVEGQQASLSNLRESMSDLEDKMLEAQNKKAQIMARAKSAKATTQVNDMLAGLGTGSSVAAFDRMTEKVEQLEAAADASKEMAATSPKRLTDGGSSLDNKFKALEAGNSVDDELLLLKKGVAALPGDVAAPTTTDDEGVLEAFKDELDELKAASKTKAE